MPKKNIYCAELIGFHTQTLWPIRLQYLHPASPLCSVSSLESEAAAVESVEIGVCHLVVEAVVVRRVESRAGAVVRPRRTHPREITAERHVGSFGLQIGQRARSKITNGGGGGGPSHQEIHRPHRLGVADAVTQAADWVGGASVVLRAGGVAACGVGHFPETSTCVQGLSPTFDFFLL